MTRKFQFYTDEEIDIIKEMAGKCTDAKIAERIKKELKIIRNPKAITIKRRSLKLSSMRIFFNEDEDIIVRKIMGTGGTGQQAANEIKKQLGIEKAAASCCNRARYIGIKRIAKHRGGCDEPISFKKHKEVVNGLIQPSMGVTPKEKKNPLREALNRLGDKVKERNGMYFYNNSPITSFELIEKAGIKLNVRN